MGNRKDAVWRIAAFLWSWVASFGSAIGGFIGLIWGAIDVLWQLITGRDGLSGSSTPADWVTRLVMWPIDNLVYAFTGNGEIELLP